MKRIIILLLAASLILLAACGVDTPPDDGTPEPGALNGTFVCEGSELRFNGDGTTIELTLTPDHAELTGLPEGETSGAYVFLFHHESWRRDKAEYFRVIIGDESRQFINCVGETGEDTVAFYAGEKDSAKLAFVKK